MRNTALTAAIGMLLMTTSPVLAQTQQVPDTEPRTMQPSTGEKAMPSSGLTDAPFLLSLAPGDTLSPQYEGAEVMVRQGDNLDSVGEITQTVLDENGRTIGAVVEVGGFLGIGAKPVAINWTKLERVGTDNGTTFVLTGISADQLQDAPEFTASAEMKNKSTADPGMSPAAPTKNPQRKPASQ